MSCSVIVVSKAIGFPCCLWLQESYDIRISEGVLQITLRLVNLLQAIYVKLSSGSANRQLIDLQAGLADSDRDRLAVFTAGTDAGVQVEIVPDHRNTC